MTERVYTKRTAILGKTHVEQELFDTPTCQSRACDARIDSESSVSARCAKMQTSRNCDACVHKNFYLTADVMVSVGPQKRNLPQKFRQQTARWKAHLAGLRAGGAGQLPKQKDIPPRFCADSLLTWRTARFPSSKTKLKKRRVLPLHPQRVVIHNVLAATGRLSPAL